MATSGVGTFGGRVQSQVAGRRSRGFHVPVVVEV